MFGDTGWREKIGEVDERIVRRDGLMPRRPVDPGSQQISEVTIGKPPRVDDRRGRDWVALIAGYILRPRILVVGRS